MSGGGGGLETFHHAGTRLALHSEPRKTLSSQTVSAQLLASRVCVVVEIISTRGSGDGRRLCDIWKDEGVSIR